MVEAIKEILDDKEELKKITTKSFEIIDKDHSGTIEESELHTVMLRIAADMGVSPPTREDVHEVFVHLDKDNSGTIDCDEFSYLIEQVLFSLIINEQESQDAVADDGY